MQNKVEDFAYAYDISHSHTQQTQTNGMQINSILQEQTESILCKFSYIYAAIYFSLNHKEGNNAVPPKTSYVIENGFV